jgi:hypothetical protein
MICATISSLVVFMEPKAEVEGEFNEWYNRHHVVEHQTEVRV